jgi:hypothetical protein
MKQVQQKVMTVCTSSASFYDKIATEEGEKKRDTFILLCNF